MKRKSHWFRILIALVLLLVAFPSTRLAQAAPPADEAVDAQIANAESAAPTVIAKDATIMGWTKDGMPTVLLRKGTNDWTCLADWPVSPGNDPQCFDPIWTAWNDAYMAGKDPEINGVGVGYMLQGGSDPSNTDPLAMEPAPGEEWVTSPAHIMLLLPDGFDANIFSTTPSQDEPFIMWDGTPYEHLMVPVVPIAADAMGDADAGMQNTMGAAPAGIIKNATIMGNPTKEGGDMVVLRKGTNGWVCYPDRTVSPGNDPQCNDAIAEAGFTNGATRDVSAPGLAYMLAGGSDESNTDPTASGPAAGDDWITTPSHVMLMVPGGFDAGYFTTDHASGYPYIMFAGTDLEHIMIPVADMPDMDMGNTPSSAAMDEEALKAEITAMEFATFDHGIDHDVAAATAETAEDFVYITANGVRQGRAEFLAGVGDEKLTFEQPVRDNVEVFIFSPDAAMIVYTIDIQGAYDGEPFTDLEYISSVWEKRDGVWQNTFLQGTHRPADMAAAETGGEAGVDTEHIANAESAAPTVIAKDATIMGWTKDGMPTVLLRKGTNGWTCIADWPVSPGNDPQCLDPMFNAWNDAMLAGKEPKITGPGVAYMLAGGSDPSNTDPFATKPAEGEDWITTPPHIMILAPDGFDAAKFATEPKQDEPYIMWDGTPYEHLMVPVVPIAADAMGDADAAMQNTMSSAPAGIFKDATIMGNPAKEGDPMVVLQKGTNGWVCYPDRTVSPGNDPSCNDATTEAGFAKGATRDVPGPGISYMLAGGSDESNTDPTATGPAPGDDWITTPSHVMLMVPGGFDTSSFTTDHASGYPYVMFAGTDMEHLMIPVADIPKMP